MKRGGNLAQVHGIRNVSDAVPADIFTTHPLGLSGEAVVAFGLETQASAHSPSGRGFR